MRVKFLKVMAGIGLLLSAGLLAACSGNGSPQQTSIPEPPPDATPFTVTDMVGHTVTLNGPARRVVALTASSCEILYAIGAGDTLVGRGTYCDYPAASAAVPEVSSGAGTNVEQIIALRPQLVLLATMAQSEGMVRQLEAAGIQTITTDATDIAGTYEAIRLTGKCTGHEAEAEKVIADMRATFAELSRHRLSGKIYFEVSPLEHGLWTSGRGTFMDEVADLLGLTNCFAGVNGYAAISEEQVLRCNPDYILTVAMYFGGGPRPDDEIASRPAWRNVNAVKNRAILNLTSNELSRPGPRLAGGARALRDFVHARQK